MMTDDIVDAAQNFKEVWGDGYLACDLGTKLTCIELEALTRLLRAIGDEQAADTWTECHAEGDDCDDLHCQCDAPECIEERAREA